MSENLQNIVLAQRASLGTARISHSGWGGVVGNRPLIPPMFWDRDEQLRLPQTEASPSQQKPCRI